MEIYIRQTPYLVQGHVKVIYVNEFNIYELCVCQREFFHMNCLISMKTPIEPPFKHTSNAAWTNNIQIIECKWSVMLSIL